MNCIRGCLRPCSCDTCRSSDEPQHEPQPAQAEDKSLLCRRDGTRLYKWLTSVLDDTLRLDTRIPVDYGWEKESSHQKVTGSPALIRLDVAALADRRMNTVLDPDSENYEENTTEEEAISIPFTLCSWALLFTEEQGLTSPVDTMSRAVDILTAWFETLILLPWVDDFYNDMHKIRNLINGANNIERPQPAGECFTCDTPMLKLPGRDDVQCRHCGRRYNSVLDLVRLKVQQEREASA